MIAMNNELFWQHVANRISQATSKTFQIENEKSIGGGCINSTSLIEGCGEKYFVKTNRVELMHMFEAEGEALAVMSQTRTVRVPEPVCWGESDGVAWLAMEYLSLGGKGSQALLGEQLAAMHRRSADRFGWHRDNTIGSTPQRNRWHQDWVDFFRDQRLGYQLSLAASKGHRGQLQRLGERMMDGIDGFFSGYSPIPSMLHGDLWGGNYATDDSGQPVIYDPAFYYGDREADIAMTELFGGFSSEFYSAYNEAWPLDSGYRTRKTLYNLYHVINHLNLFGGGYGMQAESMMEQLLSVRT